MAENVPTFVVLGGGMSGLAAARVLAGLESASQPDGPAPGRPGGPARVVLLEQSERLGGKVRTGQLDGLDVELGPDQFLRRDPSAENLCCLLGLGDEIVTPATSSAAVFSRGEMRPLPPALALGIPTDLDALGASGIVSHDGLARARLDSSGTGRAISAEELGLADPPAAGLERSAGDILREHLGDEVVDRLVDPLLGGINAGGVDSLSLAVAAPVVARALAGQSDVVGALVSAGAAPAPPRAGEAPRSAFFAIAGGFAKMVAACENELSAAGVEIRMRTTAGSIGHDGDGLVVETSSGPLHCDGIVLAVPAWSGAPLMKQLSPEAAEELSAVEHASVAVVTLSYETGALELPSSSSGVLVPRVEQMTMTAASWLSNKWPWMSTPDRQLVRVSAGRLGDERFKELDDGELASLLASELKVVAGIDAAPRAATVTRWDRAFPQYRPGHRARIARLEAALSKVAGIELAGAVLGGIGVPACITSGEAAATRLRAGTRP